MPNVKGFGCKIGIQFSDTPLIIDQNNLPTKNCKNWPKIPLNNLTLKNYLFGATNIAKNSDNKASV